MNSTIPILPKYPTIPLRMILDYEIRSSWWVGLVSWEWGQELSVKYFVWKTKRKYVRYKVTKLWEDKLKEYYEQESQAI
jgi:hypothetical protein